MTISSTASSTTVICSGSVSTFSFSFPAFSASDIQVIYTNTSGISTTLNPSQYTLYLNPAATGSLWGYGGTVTYLVAGSPPPAGSSLTITRTVPLTQTTSISNQGDFYPSVVEAALDTLCAEIQQVASRGGAYRGTWISGSIYNFGDIVQDGANGAYTNNLYVCSTANTSGTWASDLSSGYWTLALNVQTLSATAGYLPLSGGTISGNLTVTGTNTVGTLAVTNAATLTGGGTSVTKSAGNNSTNIATTAYADQTLLIGAASNVKCSVTTAGTSATLTADEAVLGLSLGGSAIKLGSYSQTVNLATTGPGGIDTGSAPASGFVAVYAIYGSGGTSILACNTTTSTGTIYSGSHMPTGYTYSALLGIWPTNGSSQFVAGLLNNRQFVYSSAGVQVLSGGNVNTYTSINLSSAIPSAAKIVNGYALTTSNSGQQLYLSHYVGQSDISLGIYGTNTGSQGWWSIPLQTPQAIYYNTSNSGAWNVSVTGYGF